MGLIPAYFREKMLMIYEERGSAWLDALPRRLAHYAEKWHFEIEGAVDNLSYNYVANVTLANGQPAVFKTGVPNKELFTEMDTLALYNGVGMVRPLRFDHDGAAFLLERIEPGIELSKLNDDDEATRIIAQIIQTLRRPAPEKHSFPHVVHNWCHLLTEYQKEYANSSSIPMRLVDQAVNFAHSLLTPAQDVLLHGDLHHYNILQGENSQWIAIDPKGVIGAPAFETARFLHNPYPQFLGSSDMKSRLARRIDIVCELLHFDREEVKMWALVDAVLSSVWSVEDNDDDNLQPMIAFAKLCMGV